MEARQNPAPFEARKAVEEELLCLERLCGETVSDMHRLLLVFDPELVEMQLVGRLFPVFSHFYKQIQDRDHERAKNLLDHYVVFLRGPPNRPTRDHFGFLPIILSFILDVAKGNRNASEFGF